MAEKASTQAGSGGQPGAPSFTQVPGAQPQGLPYPGYGLAPGGQYLPQQAYGAAPPGQGSFAGHEQQLRGFWQEQLRDVHQVPCDPAEFKNHQLPLARIKKIMKSDEDVRMISAEAPVLFAKACEMFILELTLRSWYHAEENKRRTLQRNDIAAAITKTDIFDFLIDIVPREEIKQEGQEGSYAGGAGPSTTGQTQGAPGGIPPGMFGYNPYMPPGSAPGAPGVPPMDPAQMLAYSQQYMQSMQQMAGQGWPGAAPGGQ